jgi:hypothetical protein
VRAALGQAIVDAVAELGDRVTDVFVVMLASRVRSAATDAKRVTNG